MRHSATLAPLLALSLLAAACSEPAADGELPASDLASTLARGADFDLQPAVDGSGVRAEARALRLDRNAEVEAVLEGGVIGLRADAAGTVTLDALSLELGDISVPADILPPSGIELTDVSVQLTKSATGDAVWTDGGDRADASLDVAMALKWSVLRDGRPVPLADVNVENVPVLLVVEADGDGQTLTLSADRSGAFWSWAETFELRDLSIDLHAAR